MISDLRSAVENHPNLPKQLATSARVELEKIDLVGKIFQIFLDDEGISTIAKSLILQMQVTYARIALVQEDFFQNEDHPARVLLKELSSLASHWTPNKDNLGADVLFKIFSSIVQGFLETERVSTIDFQSYMFELLAYSEAQRQQDMLTTQRLIDSEYGVSVSENARSKVNDLLEGMSKDKEISQPVNRILNEAWRNVLYLYALKYGVDSDFWNDAVKTIEGLFESLASADSYSSRADFLSNLPKLLSQLHEGFSAINLDIEVMNDLLEGLEQEHKKIAAAISLSLEGTEIVDVAVITQGAEIYTEQRKLVLVNRKEKLEEAEEARKIEVMKKRKLEQEALEEKERLEKEAKQRKNNEALKDLAQGVSLVWKRDGEQVRCRIAAFIKHTNKIYFN